MVSGRNLVAVGGGVGLVGVVRWMGSGRGLACPGSVEMMDGMVGERERGVGDGVVVGKMEGGVVVVVAVVEEIVGCWFVGIVGSWVEDLGKDCLKVVGIEDLGFVVETVISVVAGTADLVPIEGSGRSEVFETADFEAY